MSRNIFLSFLGTNDYVDCNYYLDQQPDSAVANVKFMQEALVQTVCKGFTASDQVVILATEKAKAINYLSRLDSRGLQERLNSLAQRTLQAPHECVIIKEGFTEGEIWDVFQVIDNQVQQNDVVYLDITHAFRYLPMLGVVLLNFLKVTKSITVGGVYYGAFEKLGPAFEVKKMPLEDRNAPVLNLLPMIELQSWANAAQNFSKYGTVNEVVELTKKTINPILKSTKGKDVESNSLRHFSTLVENLIPMIYTNRGGELMTYDFDQLTNIIDQIKEKEIAIKPLKSLLAIIEAKINSLTDSPYVWLSTSKWCLQHNLIQQGLTQLQEGILTYLVEYAKVNYQDNFYDYKQKKSRNLLSSLLSIAQQNIPPSEWKNEVSDNKDKSFALLSNPKLHAFSSVYAKITTLRNDINHAGYTQDAKSHKEFSGKLRDYIECTEDILTTSNNTLVNVSNHPSANWPTEQLMYAQKDFPKILDIPFPTISPALTLEEMDKLIDEYARKVLALNPAAVHVMGEMTFTFRLVNVLKAQGILCLASTTERIATVENGVKTSQFKFVQFRSY